MFCGENCVLWMITASPATCALNKFTADLITAEISPEPSLFFTTPTAKDERSPIPAPRRKLTGLPHHRQHLLHRALMFPLHLQLWQHLWSGQPTPTPRFRRLQVPTPTQIAPLPHPLLLCSSRAVPGPRLLTPVFFRPLPSSILLARLLHLPDMNHHLNGAPMSGGRRFNLPLRELSYSHAALFRLRGQEFNLSVNSLNVLLGAESDESLRDELYESATCEIPANYSISLTDHWSELSIDTVYVPCLSKSAHIRDDGLRLCHRVLAYNFFGRSDLMNIVTIQEVFILDSMFWREKLNFGFYLAHQWQYSANHFTCKVPLGSFITLLEQKLHVAINRLIHIPPTYFTLNDLRAMQLLYVNTDGNF
ncbi:hypothetical protein C2S52_021655 [Perilla frutescens var. hirtella]|nr:hypothetical protein C2S52_021655 [Perilla frutescens var. hirtella]